MAATSTTVATGHADRTRAAKPACRRADRRLDTSARCRCRGEGRLCPRRSKRRPDHRIARIPNKVKGRHGSDQVSSPDAVAGAGPVGDEFTMIAGHVLVISPTPPRTLGGATAPKCPKAGAGNLWRVTGERCGGSLDGRDAARLARFQLPGLVCPVQQPLFWDWPSPLVPSESPRRQWGARGSADGRCRPEPDSATIPIPGAASRRMVRSPRRNAMPGAVR